MAHVSKVLGGIAVVLFATATASAQTVPAPAPTPAPAPAPTPAPAPAPVAAAPVAATPGTPLPPDLGDTGTFVIDQVSGFRGRIGGGVNYYGPIGLAYNSFTTQLTPTADCTGSTCSITTTEATTHSTSLWLAPSIDYFFAPNVSVGGLFSVDATFGGSSIKTSVQTGGSVTQDPERKVDLPTTVSFTLMPRIGYFFRINDRISIWPRVGLGYFSGSQAVVDSAGNTSKQGVSAFISTIDAGFIYQITDNVFFRAAPGVTFSMGGSGSLETKNGAGVATSSQSGDGKVFQFELTSGFGANFNL